MELKNLFVVILLIVTTSSFSQEEDSIPTLDTSFLKRNIDSLTPVKNKAPAGTYTVIVQYILDKEGNISDVKPLTSHGYGMEAEVVKAVLKGKRPRWEPSQQIAVRTVKFYNKYTYTFSVPDKKHRKKRNKEN